MSRRPHEPTEQTRRMVESMTSFGIPQKEICAVLGIDDKTLHKYYRFEIDTAVATANSAVAQRLYQKAVDGDTSSMIFWLKTRARWSESMNIDHTSKGEQISWPLPQTKLDD